MRKRVASEAGFTLIELLVAASLSLVVFGAATASLTAYSHRSAQTQRLNDAQDATRTAVTLMAKQLRNLASPTPEQPMAIDSAGAKDLVFQTVDPVGPNSGANKVNVRRLRYCLGTAKTDRLYLQSQRWTTATTPAVPDTTACPGTGWTTTREVVADVTNDYGGQARPIFSFNAISPTSITRVATQLWVDPQPTRAPKEVSLSTAVDLRNQNRAPIASFTMVNGSGDSVTLNGSQSEDPENQTLTFSWSDTYDGVTTKLPCDGVVCSYTPTGTGAHQLKLTVTDPAGLQNVADPQTKTI